MGSPRPPKLVMFGLDAGTFDLLNPWIEQGHLPHLQSLLERGASGPLRSTIPPLTPCAWTTMMTGMNPGRHGVVDFVLPRPQSYGRRLATARDRMTPPLWLLLNQLGLTTGVINVPTTYPPDDLDGYMISGMIGAFAFNADVVRPEGFFPELQQAIGDFPMAPVVRNAQGYDLRALDHEISRLEATCDYLMDTRPTDIFIVVVSYVDHLCHFFFRDRALPGHEAEHPDMILYGYQAADRLLGHVLSRCDEETHILLTSDHGAGPLDCYLNIDGLLQEAGLLHMKQAVGGKGRLRRLADKTPKWARGLLPPRLRRRIVENVREQYEFEVDWSKSRVFRRRPGGGLYLNLAGREPEGIIPAADYESAREQIIAELRAAFDRHPELKGGQIYRREEVYSGPQTALAPDIIYLLEELRVHSTSCAHPEAGVIMTLEQAARLNVPDGYRSGGHKMDGIFAAVGPRVRPGAQTNQAQLTDVTPTALALLQADARQDFDGRVLNEIMA